MGNKEESRGGIYQSYPSNKSYDMGVDNPFNPKRYICTEYIARFESNQQFHGYLNGLNGIRFDMKHDKEPFVLLHERFRERLSSCARRSYLHYFEEFKKKKVTQEELTTKMSPIIQELSKYHKIAAAINENVGSASEPGLGTSAEIGTNASLMVAIGNTSAEQNEDAENTSAPRTESTSPEMEINTTLALAIGNSIYQQNEDVGNTPAEMGTRAGNGKYKGTGDLLRLIVWREGLVIEGKPRSKQWEDCWDIKVAKRTLLCKIEAAYLKTTQTPN